MAMNKQIIETYKYMQNYMKQKETHEDYIDYYELFNLDKNITPEEFTKKIKNEKLHRIFHSDQENFVENIFKPTFKECSREFNNMLDIFTTEYKKSKYDQMLKEKQTPTKIDEQEIDEKKILEDAIIMTTQKHGFNNGYLALQYALRGDFSHISRDNGNRMALETIGKNRLREIVASERENIMERNGDNLVADYFHKLISKQPLKQQADTFYKLCMETVKEKNENPSSSSLENALTAYQEYNYPSAFSNRNNIRDEFLQGTNISNNDVWLLINIKIHNEYGQKQEECLFSNITKKSNEDQNRIFSEIIKKEVSKINAQNK